MIFVLWVVGALIALIVLALVFVPMFIDESQIVELAQNAVRDDLGGELVVSGDTDISLFPTLALAMNGTSLKLPAKTKYDPAIEADIETLDIGISIIPLLTGSTEVGEIKVKGVKAVMTQPEAAPEPVQDTEILSDAEWEKRGQLMRNARANELKRLMENPPAASIALAVDAIRVEDVHFTMLTPEGNTATELQLDEFTLTDVNTQDRPIGLRAKLEVMTAPDASINLGLDGSLQVPPTLQTVTINELRYNVEGALSEPVSGNVKGKLVVATMAADLQMLTKTAAGSIEGKVDYAPLSSPQIKLVVETNRLDLNKLTPAGTATDEAEQEEATPVVPLPLPVGPLKGLDLDMSLGANELVVGAHSITETNLHMRVLDAVAVIDTLKGAMHSGQLDAKMTMNARRPIVEVSLDGTVAGVNIDELLTAEGMTDTASGRVNIAWDIDTEGSTAEALKIALDGDMKVDGKDVQIQAVSAQKLMCDAISQIRQKPLTQPMPEATDVTALALGIDFEDGLAKLSKLDMSTPGVKLGGRGQVALEDLTFAMVLEAKVGEQLTELDPACEVEERYAAVDWPVKCKGNLSSGDPAQFCKVDSESILKQIIENEAKSQLRKETEKLGEKAGNILKNLFQ